MRNVLFAPIAACVALAAALFQSQAAEECMIGDAALCLAAPNCHWDGERRGCFPGPAKYQDVCAAHEGKAICDTSSLGCKWSDATSKCESKIK
jgi:hypothetical protein